MVFNTGAALLDAVVLAVISREKDGTYGTRSPRMCEVFWRFQNLRCIRSFAGFRRMNVWKPTIWNMQAETGNIIS